LNVSEDCEGTVLGFTTVRFSGTASGLLPAFAAAIATDPL
jgi:hypothetical protein